MKNKNFINSMLNYLKYFVVAWCAIALNCSTVIAQTTQQDVAEFIANNFLTDSITGTFDCEEEVWMSDTYFANSDTLKSWFDSNEVVTPYNKTWVAMIDGNPTAHWPHPCLWVVVDDSLQNFEIYEMNYPPTVYSGSGAEDYLSCVNDLLNCDCFQVTEPAIDTAAVAPPIVEDDCLYAVLFSCGDTNPNNNDEIGFWYDIKNVYNKLRNAGYKKENIFVYYKDGTEDIDGDGNNDVTDLDLPANGISDITGKAEEAPAKINELCNDPDNHDNFLFIYGTTHGGREVKVGGDFFDPEDSEGYLHLRGRSFYSETSLKGHLNDNTFCRVTVMLDACHAGSFTDVSNNTNRDNVSVYTAAASSQLSYLRTTGSEFTNLFFAKDIKTHSSIQLFNHADANMGDNVNMEYCCKYSIRTPNICPCLQSPDNCPQIAYFIVMNDGTLEGPFVANGKCTNIRSSTPGKSSHPVVLSNYKLNQCCPDFGDAPDTGQICLGAPRNYQTTWANDGPQYFEFELQKFGQFADSEFDGQPNCPADGDDTNPAGEPDDEDGIVFIPEGVDIHVNITRPGFNEYLIDGWFDMNNNGVFDHPAERLISRVETLAPGFYTFFEPLGFNGEDYYSRFRLTYGVDPIIDLRPYGEYLAADSISHGEVEDYAPVEYPGFNKIPQEPDMIPGEPFYYTFEVNNPCPHPITNVIIVDILSPNLQYIGDDYGGTFSSGTYTANVGVVAPQETVMIQIQVVLDPNHDAEAEPMIYNTGELYYAEGPPMTSQTCVPVLPPMPELGCCWRCDEGGAVVLHEGVTQFDCLNIYSTPEVPYSWHPGPSLPTDSYGCCPTPPDVIVTTNGPVCEGEPLTFVAESDVGSTYAWFAPDGTIVYTASVYTFNPTFAQNGEAYTVIATSPDGCESEPFEVVVEVIACGANPNPISAETCSGEPYEITFEEDCTFDPSLDDPILPGGVSGFGVIYYTDGNTFINFPPGYTTTDLINEQGNTPGPLFFGEVNSDCCQPIPMNPINNNTCQPVDVPLGIVPMEVTTYQVNLNAPIVETTVTVHPGNMSVIVVDDGNSCGVPTARLVAADGTTVCDVLYGPSCANNGQTFDYDFSTACQPELTGTLTCSDCPISCPDNLYIPDNIPEGTHQAAQSIISDGTVPDNCDVEFKAGDVIRLDGGFTVPSGSKFSGVIDDCTDDNQ